MAEGQSTTVAPAVEYRDLTPLGFPGYRVGDDGSVWSCIVRGRYPGQQKPLGNVWYRLSPGRHYDGHLFVNLRGKQVYVHRLVLLAFVGPCPEGMEACHFPDRDPSNNARTNLRWDTKPANSADALLHGTRATGSKHGMSKLSDSQVNEIRSRPASQTSGQLAHEFGVSPSTIRRARSKMMWRQLASEPGTCLTCGPGEKNHQAKLTDEHVREIRKAYATGTVTLKQLGAKHNVSFALIGHIVRRKAWKHIA